MRALLRAVEQMYAGYRTPEEEELESFRNAVLEDDDLQEQVISIINTATATIHLTSEDRLYKGQP